MTRKYKVIWDNGASASGSFPDEFDTFDEANTYGKNWADESNLRDLGTIDPDEGYTYDVIEIDVPTPEEIDAHEGIEHMRIREKGSP